MKRSDFFKRLILAAGTIALAPAIAVDTRRWILVGHFVKSNGIIYEKWLHGKEEVGYVLGVFSNRVLENPPRTITISSKDKLIAHISK